MGAAPHRLAALGRDEGGYTMVELLVATTIAVVVLGVAAMLFSASIGTQVGITSRANHIQQARTAVERMTRELRQAWAAPTASASQLTMLTYVHSASCGGAAADTAIPCQVTYTCASGACIRTERNPDGTGNAAPVRVVSGLASDNVFTYSPNSTAPAYVGATLTFAPKEGQSAVILEDGAAFGNPSVPAS